MAIKRRELIKIAALAGLSWHTLAMSAGQSGQKRILGVIKTASEQWSAVCFDLLAGKLLYQLPLPVRAHGSAAFHQQIAAVVARRPGTFVTVFDVDSGKLIEQINAPEGYAFNGHVAFTEHSMYVSGEKLGSSEGMLFTYDRDRWSLLSKTDLQGLGPHEIRLHSPNYLVVGIGGLQTDGRDVVNHDTMQPCLLCVDPVTGQEQWRLQPDNHLLSTRHLTLTDSGHAVIAMQYQSDIPEARALIAITDLPVDQKPTRLLPLQADDLDWMNFNNYIGSVAACGNQIIATSPRGHRVGVWDLQSRQFQQSYYLQDVCSLASDGRQWWAGTGVGVIKASDTENHLQTGLRWDNHWSFISA